MTIATIYLVSVGIHENVYREFGHTDEYFHKVHQATRGNLTSGQNSCSEVEEWAEYSTRAEAVACEKRLMDMNYYFAGKLLPGLV